MTQDKAYRIIYSGILKQVSDMSTGGTDISSSVDMPCARDGQGRFIIRGTALAGIMVATAKALGYKVPKSISNDDFGDKSKQPSNWKPFNSYIVGSQNGQVEQPQTLLRQYVKIDDATGAAENSALFDMEVIPRGTSWQFMLELDTQFADSNSEAENLANAVLLHWQQHGLFIGRRAVAGTGWFKLEKLHALRLRTKDVCLWPDNSDIPANVFKQLYKDASKHYIPKISQSGRPSPSLHRVSYQVTLSAGPNKDLETGEEWGLDGFFIGGHGAEQPLSLEEPRLGAAEAKWQDFFQVPPGYTLDPQDTPDNFFVYNEQGQPFIPGSSIRGVLRHQIQRNLNSEYREPSENSEIQKQLEALFGSTEQSSGLYIGDAQLSSDKASGIVMHNHAEDEFTAGVFESAKFVRCSVVEGEFTCHIHLENQSKAKLMEQQALLEGAFAYAKQGFLPIGGKQWVDSGWLRLQVEQTVSLQDEQGVGHD
ncbi:RAMP superfamily CRISPR-associated protein [Agarivorans sp. Z349TD_8]|uniref:RAMP superfamily CRISPR-associated protein n=1 Tax=Agarivorans sp. Z349TD_8 TaxID=3421434 RepID=UPI003D7EEB43